MNLLLRKLRGVIGVGLTWAVGWSVIMAIIVTVIGIVDPDSIDEGEEIGRIVRIVATVGFFSGAIFAGILAFAERRKPIRELSLWRVAIWGVLGGAALPLLTGINDAVVFNTVPLATLFSVGTVALARRAARREALAAARESRVLPQESP